MSNRRIVVVAAHPDDEIIGCGATMAKHADSGDQVHVVLVAEGATSRKDHDPADVDELRRAANRAASAVGAASVTLLGMPDNRLDSLDLLDLVRPLEAVLAQYSPHVVYTHHPGDLNVDHRMVHQAVMTAARPQPGSCIETVLLFEVASSTGWGHHAFGAFLPNWYIDIAQWLPDKRRALEEYSAEMRPWPHARSIDAIDALARWRGSSVGVEAAEAFELHRRVLG